MKMYVKLSPNVTAEVIGTHTEIFEQIAAVQDVFGETKCGKCQKTQLKYIVREDKDGNKYYELLCLSCFAKLTFGQNKGNKAGNLFPRRIENKNSSIMGLQPGTRLPNNGWIKWDKEKNKFT